MATIRWCPIFPKWDIYQPLFKLSHQPLRLYQFLLFVVDAVNRRPKPSKHNQYQSTIFKSRFQIQHQHPLTSTNIIKNGNYQRHVLVAATLQSPWLQAWPLYLFRNGMPWYAIRIIGGTERTQSRNTLCIKWTLNIIAHIVKRSLTKSIVLFFLCGVTSLLTHLDSNQYLTSGLMRIASLLPSFRWVKWILVRSSLPFISCLLVR